MSNEQEQGTTKRIAEGGGIRRFLKTERGLLVFALVSAMVTFVLWFGYTRSLATDAALLGNARFDPFGAGRLGRLGVTTAFMALLASRSRRRDVATTAVWAFALACLLKAFVNNSVHLLTGFYAALFIGGAFLRQYGALTVGIGLPLLQLVTESPFGAARFQERSDFAFVVLCAATCAATAWVRDSIVESDAPA